MNIIATVGDLRRTLDVYPAHLPLEVKINDSKGERVASLNNDTQICNYNNEKVILSVVDRDQAASAVVEGDSVRSTPTPLAFKFPHRPLPGMSQTPETGNIEWVVRSYVTSPISDRTAIERLAKAVGEIALHLPPEQQMMLAFRMGAERS